MKANMEDRKAARKWPQKGQKEKAALYVMNIEDGYFISQY